MAKRRSGWRTWGTVLAAYLLVIQATLTGMALGDQAAAPHLAGAFDVICAPTGSTESLGHSPGDHRAPGSCCVAGCVMLGGGMAPAPEQATVVPRISVDHAGLALAIFDAPTRTPERSSKASRAPPATA